MWHLLLDLFFFHFKSFLLQVWVFLSFFMIEPVLHCGNVLILQHVVLMSSMDLGIILINSNGSSDYQKD